MYSIILTGYMGSGKSGVSACLRELTGMEVIDTDIAIEEASGRRISEIFATDGETFFREMETDLLRALAEDGTKRIISTGGGMPLREINRSLLKECGTVYYLSAKETTIYERLAGDTTRPLLAGCASAEEKIGKIAEMMKMRDPIYRDCADHIIETDDLSIGEVAETILKIEKEGGKK